MNSEKIIPVWRGDIIISDFSTDKAKQLSDAVRVGLLRGVYLLEEKILDDSELKHLETASEAIDKETEVVTYLYKRFPLVIVEIHADTATVIIQAVPEDELLNQQREASNDEPAGRA